MRMPVPSPQRPVSVAVVFLQPECNMSCSFCVTDDDFDVLDFQSGVELLQHLREGGTRTVTFGGGEPFAWPGDVVALARRAKVLGLHVQIGTNGIALPRGFAELECVDRYVLPLESTETAVHDELRRHGRGHHRVILRRLEELRRARKSVTVSTVLTRVNTGGVGELAEWLRRYHSDAENVHAWHLYQFLPLGRGGASNASGLSIPEGEYRAACHAAKALDLPFRVFRRTNMYRSSTVEFFWSKDGKIESGSEALARMSHQPLARSS